MGAANPNRCCLWTLLYWCFCCCLCSCLRKRGGSKTGGWVKMEDADGVYWTNRQTGETTRDPTVVHPNARSGDAVKDHKGPRPPGQTPLQQAELFMST